MDPQFSSNMENLMIYNPGYAGSQNQMNAFLVNRQQWMGLGWNTSAVGFDTKVKLFDREHGVGITAMNDNAAMLNNVSINFIYSYRKNLWGGTLGAGMAFGFNNLTFQGDSIRIPELSDYGVELKGAIDALSINAQAQDTKMDFALGAFFEDKTKYLGISLTHLTRPEMELNEQGVYFFYNRVLYLTGGYKIYPEKNNKLEIIPSFFFKSDLASWQVDLNCNIWYNKRVLGGMSYRYQDAVVLLGGYKLKNGMTMGLAYDFVTSAIHHQTFSTVEIFVRYSFDIDVNKKKFGYKSLRIL